MKEEKNEKKEQTKMVGGQIPADLYWLFKVEHAKRKENATTALENAIRLYVEANCEVE